MNDAALLVVIPALSVIAAQAGVYLAARYGANTSLAIAETTTDTDLTISERDELRAKNQAWEARIDAEIERLREDNAGLRDRLGKVEHELNSTRLANITLEQERARLIDKVAELEANRERQADEITALKAEVRVLNRQVNGSGAS